MIEHLEPINIDAQNNKELLKLIQEQQEAINQLIDVVNRIESARDEKK